MFVFFLSVSAFVMLRLWLLCAALAVTVTLAQEAEKLTQPNPCTSRQTCSECMQTPTCAWCAVPVSSSAMLVSSHGEGALVGQGTRHHSVENHRFSTGFMGTIFAIWLNSKTDI